MLFLLDGGIMNHDRLTLKEL
jgi:hypothetical protein